MTAAVFSLIGVTVGALLSVVGNFLIVRHQTKANTESLEIQLQVQIEQAKLDRDAQLILEREQHRGERIEIAHEQLMLWCSELESKIYFVFSGVHSNDPVQINETKRILVEWPWKTLRIPPYMATTCHYLSKETYSLIGKFGQKSALFVNASETALSNRTQSELQVEESKNELLAVLVEIRDNARKELSE